MQDRQLMALLFLLAGSILANLAIHWGAICPALYRRGWKFPTGFLFWRIFQEQRRYRDLRQARGQPANLYYVAFILTWFNLLLVIAVGLRALYDTTQPVP